MYSSTIHIDGVDSARAFVAMTDKYRNTKIKLNCREYCVDAHSIIGILSLDLSRPISITADGDDLNSLIGDLEPYMIKKED